MKVSEQLEFPIEAVTRTFAAIALKGAGKTYVSQLMAEQMLDNGAQVLVIDPVGNWFSLRLAADGKHKGKDIFIIGGEHGDLPLLAETGQRIAKLLAEKPVSAVLDVSELRKHERQRFLTDFGEEFFHLKKRQKSPVHIFLEEAQMLLPQRFGAETARLHGAWTDIIRLGRNYGIGETMISQRPQSIDKEVLNMTECLIALQVNGVQERKALEEWVQEKGADRSLVGELPGLERGEAYVWSPSWLRIFKRVKFGKKTTFDASATPEVGKAAKTITLSSMDFEALRQDLQDLVKRAQEDDPKVLRAKIAQLSALIETQARQIAKAEVPLVAASTKPDPEAIAKIRAEIESDLEAQLKRIGQAVTDRLTGLASKLGDVMNMTADPASWKLIPNAQKLEKAFAGVRSVPTTQNPAAPRHLPTAFTPPPHHPHAKDRPEGSTGHLSGSLSRPQRAILEALQQGRSINRPYLKRTWVGFLASASPRSSAFTNNLSALRTAGLIDYGPESTVTLTTSGQKLMGEPQAMLSEAQLHDTICNMLSRPQAAIFRALARDRGDVLARGEVAERAGASPTSSAFSNNLSAMRSLGLIDYGPNSTVFLSADLFF